MVKTISYLNKGYCNEKNYLLCNISKKCTTVTITDQKDYKDCYAGVKPTYPAVC